MEPKNDTAHEGSEKPAAAADAAAAAPVVDPAPSKASEKIATPEKAEAVAKLEAAPVVTAGKDAKPAVDDPYAALALAENSTLDAARLAEIKALAGKHKLTLEAAKDLLAKEEAAQEGVWGGFEAAISDYKGALAKDYGDKLESEEKYVDAFFDRFAPPGSKAATLKQVLDDTGLRHYPPLWEALREVGRSISEPSKIVGGRSQRDAVPLDEDAEWKRNYPNSGERPSKLVGLARTA